MKRSLIAAALALVAFSFCIVLPADARPRLHTPASYAADPGCNVIFPCDGVAPSARGELVVKAMHGFGAARLRYTPRADAGSTVVAHPSGCPGRAFCGCGAAVRVFGSPVRSLWLAAAWFRFPRAAPAAGMVAVRRHHVFVLEGHVGGSTWLAYDANSGGHATRIHTRSIDGYTIVNPRAG